MKLRLNENSVRLRLRRSEVERFGATGSVSAQIRFPQGGSLTFALTCGPHPRLAVAFSGDSLEVRVPEAQGKSWAAGEDVGMYGSSEAFEILVEKDFRRVSMPSPDDADRYLNPRAHRA